MGEPILTLNGRVINQLCPDCYKRYYIISSAYRLYKKTKGICGICGSCDSWSIKYRGLEEVKRNQTN